MNDNKNQEGKNIPQKSVNSLDLWIQKNLFGGGGNTGKVVHESTSAVPKPAPREHVQPPKSNKTAENKPDHLSARHQHNHGQSKNRPLHVLNEQKSHPPRPGQSHPPHPVQPVNPSAPTPVNQPPEKKKNGFFFGSKNKNSESKPGIFGGKKRWNGTLRVIPLGGLDEVGSNCTVLEYGRDIILIDLGFQFPDEDLLGVDYVIPDISYLQDKLDRIRAVIFTHGHLDHIGAVPYLMPKLNFPTLYGTRLTMGLIERRLEEFGHLRQTRRNVITPEDKLKLGAFEISFFPVNHSIPDAVGIVVKTPAGNIATTGDFKFDFTPSGDQKPADFARIASLANDDMAALMIDSTNALKPGYTISEKKIGESLDSIIKNITGRIIIASFASQIGRIQQIVNSAVKNGRTVYLSGRSLMENTFMAQKLGYLKVAPGVIQDVRKCKKVPDEKVLILTTGSQGEDVSALSRMALEEHSAVKIKKGDTVVLSSSPIPGNEKAIFTVTNNLSRLGAQIINNQIMDVHASGHAQQEDLKLMMSLVRAKYIVPIHGEYYMRNANREVAKMIGYREDHTIMIENGDVMVIENNEVRTTTEKIPVNYVLVDGLGVGDVSAQVIMDRQTLAENGVVVIVIPVDEKTRRIKGEIDVISRGFIYMKQSEEVIVGLTEVVRTAYHNILDKRADLKRQELKNYIRESVDKYVHQKIERHPLVIPIIVEK